MRKKKSAIKSLLKKIPYYTLNGNTNERFNGGRKRTTKTIGKNLKTVLYIYLIRINIDNNSIN